MNLEVPGMRDRILNEAARLLAAGGYRGISMREIAEACNISKPALYYHFKDKESLVLAVFEGYLERMHRLVADACAHSPQGSRRLNEIMRGIFAQPPEQRALIRIGWLEMGQFSPEGRAHFGVIYEEKFLGPLAGVFQAGMDAREFRRMEPHLAVWMFLGIMSPFFLSSASVPQVRPPLNELLGVFLSGMGMGLWRGVRAGDDK